MDCGGLTRVPSKFMPTQNLRLQPYLGIGSLKTSLVEDSGGAPDPMMVSL